MLAFRIVILQLHSAKECCKYKKIMFFTVALLSVAIIGLAFALLAIRILLKKNGEFKGTCANNNPFMQKAGVTCGVCGKTAGEDCRKEDLPEVQISKS
jgi:hypothetical protein